MILDLLLDHHSYCLIFLLHIYLHLRDISEEGCGVVVRCLVVQDVDGEADARRLVVLTVLEVGAGLAATHQTLVLDVIDHEAPVVHELSEAAGEQDIDVLVRANHDGVSNIAAEALGVDHAENGAPPLAAAVKQVIDEV